MDGFDGTEAVVDVANVTCTFGRVRALDGLSLSVLPGTVHGIVGPNGAGKTTLIDVICGLIRPSQGTVRVLGEEVAAGRASLRARIGVLPQETALYDEVTAQQNLRFAAALYGVPRPDARIAEVLELVGLSARARDVVRGFSGGMQRRLRSRARCCTILHCSFSTSRRWASMWRPAIRSGRTSDLSEPAAALWC